MEKEEIYTEEDLEGVIDVNGNVYHNISIRGSNITTLGRLKTVHGTLGVDCESLYSLGELSFINNDFWISSASKNLKSLCELKSVGENVNLRYSKINSLGKLENVGGKLSLRDTDISDVSGLRNVGELFLPKRFSNENFNFIKVKNKIRFWSDKYFKSGKDLEDSGGGNLSCSISVDFTKKKYSFHFNEWKVPTNPNDKFFVSKENLVKQTNNFNHYKESILANDQFLNEYSDSQMVQKFFDRLKFELLTLLKTNKIDEETFIEKAVYYEKVFSKFVVRKHQFMDFLKLKDKNEILSEIFIKSYYSPSFSEIHELELKTQRRIIYGKNLVIKCVNLSELNGFIIKNIDDFYLFIEGKLDAIYKDHFSFYYSLFGEVKTVKEINDEFPVDFKMKPNNNFSFDYVQKTIKLSKEYILQNKNHSVFTKYYDVKKKHELSYKQKRNFSKLFLSYDRSPLSYSGESSNSFVFFVENIIEQIFSSLIHNSQDEFRVSKGVPKIGEGWVGESELYNLIKNHFDKHKVVQHGRPKWLGRQHLDIWLPEAKIAIEYHGRQHFEPIAFFGGEEAFKQNQIRDKMKKEKCVANNVHLIEVIEGYDFNFIIQMIQENLK
jgi:hypothetical protein